MRIIGGIAKGRRIFAPVGQDTRPTQDRVREAIFSILQGTVQGADVLDLFAGSGALGLEAVSRGARWAVSVDNAQEAMACIRRNIVKLDFEERMLTMKCDWQRAVRKLRQMQVRFDLVFLDPPYRMTDTPAICERLAREGLLRKNALVVIEHQKGAGPSLPESFCQEDVRCYGDTGVSFFEYT